jgi:hypothetical protein
MASGPPRNPVKRPYQRSGQHIIAKAAPFLVDRITNATVVDDALTPLERAARDWRAQVLDDLGGADAVPAAKRAVLDAALGSKIILDSLDRFIFELTGSGRGLVNRRSRHAFRIVTDRMRVADGFVRQIQTLGLERTTKPPLDLTAYLRERYVPPAPSENGSQPPPLSSAASTDTLADSGVAPTTESGSPAPARPPA